MNAPTPFLSGDFQSIAALAVVVITLGVFIWRAFRSKKTGCGGGCGCPVKPNQKGNPKSSETL